MGPGKYLIFFLIKFPFECRQNHVWGPICDPSYDHFYKCDHFGNKCIYMYKYMREGKKGREKGKGKREEKKGRETGKRSCNDSSNNRGEKTCRDGFATSTIHM